MIEALNKLPFEIARLAYKGISRIQGALFNLRHPFDLPPLPAAPKISFCTTCMRRLHHLKQTLPQNINDNLDYPNVEWVVLDYSSTDNLESWIKSEMRSQIEAGLVVFGKIQNKKFYNSSHAKNLAHKLASGQIVCNIDADNFTGKGFATYLAKEFKDTNLGIAHPLTFKTTDGFSGKIALRTDVFLFFGGYNESLQGYGYDDTDLIKRVKTIRTKSLDIRNNEFKKIISHSDTERLTNFRQSEKDKKSTWRKNMHTSVKSIMLGKFIANKNKPWGSGAVYINFSQEPTELQSSISKL